MKKTILASAIAVAGLMGSAQAATLNAGSTYNMNIIADGISCFTFGDCTAVPTSAFTDQDADAAAATGSANPSFGSAIGGDGLAGVINISTVSDGSGGVTFTVNSFNMDTYLGTAGGAFATQGTNVGTMSGSVDAAGNVTLDTTGREGMAQYFNTSLGAQPWNAGAVHTSGTDVGPAATLTGSALDGAGNAVLVSSNTVNGWGFFNGTPYTEVFSVQFVEIPSVPVPAAVWLFGSGLVGLAGIARRKKQA